MVPPCSQPTICQSTPSFILDNFKPHSPTTLQPPQPQLRSANGTTVLPSAQTNSFESCLLLLPPHSPVPGSTGLPSLPISTARIHLSSSPCLCITNCARPCHQQFRYGHLRKRSRWSPSFFSLPHTSVCPSLFGVSHSELAVSSCLLHIRQWFPKPGPLLYSLVTCPASSPDPPSSDWALASLIVQFGHLLPTCPCQGHHGQICCPLSPEHCVPAFEFVSSFSLEHTVTC